MNNKIMTVLAGLLMACSFFTFSVHAEETTNQPGTPPAEEQEQKENDKALTPEGNMSLVDDISSEEDKNKQFITLVTKDGNYFYLIIDRDDKGNNTVHFLNQVDEEDLFSLMDEKDAKAIQEEMSKQPEQNTEKQEAEAVNKVAEKKEHKEINFMPLIVLIGAVLAGAVAFVVKKLKKKKQETNKPDPDQDYADEEDFDFIKENNASRMDTDTE